MKAILLAGREHGQFVWVQHVELSGVQESLAVVCRTSHLLLPAPAAATAAPAAAGAGCWKGPERSHAQHWHTLCWTKVRFAANRLFMAIP